MKTLIMANGAEIPILGCYGETEFFQGVQRQVLDFRIDPKEYTLAEVDEAFTGEKCVSLTIRETEDAAEPLPEVQEGEGGEVLEAEPPEKRVIGEYVHKDFTMRVSLSKQKYVFAGGDGSVSLQEQISVKMAQQSETEKQVAALGQQMTDAQLALCDVYELIAGEAN